MYSNYFDRHLLDLEPLTYKEIRELQKEEAEIKRQYFNRTRFKGGKSRGKMLGSILVGALTAAFAPQLGLASNGFMHNLGNFMLGASLFSSVWTATHQQNLDSGNNLDVKRFDRAAEQMSSDTSLPVVYGERLITGNQTWHETDADAQTLHKHVVLCEGGIEGVQSVTANDLLVPTEVVSDSGEVDENGKPKMKTETEGIVFTLQNVKYKDATVEKNGKNFKITANGKTREIYLCDKNDTNGSFWSYQMSVGGLLTYLNSLSEGWQAFPVAATNKLPGELHDVSLTNVYKKAAEFKSDTVSGGTSYKYHDCEAPANYETTGAYPNMAWLDLTFTTQSDFSGNPSISAVVKGKKVYDVRTGKTVYSTNPAMCLRDFILSKRYGMGNWFEPEMLDDDSWAESADYCDEIITFLDGSGALVQAKRYELNMVIDQKRTGLEWVQEILANFAGYLVYSDGKLKLRIEQQTPVSYRFNDTNCSDLKVEPLKLSDTPNRYEVTIIDPLNNWSSIKALCEDFADQKLRQRIVTKTVNLEGVTSQNQALRLARFYRDYNLVCPFQVSFKTGMQGMNLEPGDVVTVSFHEVFDNLPIRIAEIKETESGTYEISGRQYNDTIYNDVMGGGIHYYNYSGSNGLNGGSSETPDGIRPNKPRNVKAKTQYRRYEDGRTGYEVVVSYDLPAGEDIETGLVYYKLNHAPGENIVFSEGVPADEAGYELPWNYAGDSPTKCVISSAKLGDIYKIKVITRSKGGLLSDASDVVTVKVLPKETVPSQPHNISYDFTKSFLFNWDDVADSDVVYYEIRSDKNVGSPIGLLGRTNTPSAEVKLTKRKGTVYVYAINAQKKSSYPASCEWVYPKPNAPAPVQFAETPRGMRIILPTFPRSVEKARLYITGVDSSDVLDTENTVYEFKGEPSVYSIRVCYVDRIGEGYVSNEYTFTINPTFKSEWIADESISLKKVDKFLSEKIESGAGSVEAIATIVKNLNKSPSESGYSAITQLGDAINLRVQKGDIINQINLTPQGTTIDGKHLHVTGTTLFDNDVITNGMIKAGAITADKLSANTIALGGNQGIKGGAVTLNADGMTVTNDNGTSVVFNSSGMSFVDRNNNIFSNIGRILVGSAHHGQYVKFSVPWDVTPQVILAPINLQTNVAGYSNQNIFQNVCATEVSNRGFRVLCSTVLGQGSSSEHVYNTELFSCSRPIYGHYGDSSHHLTEWFLAATKTLGVITEKNANITLKISGNGESFMCIQQEPDSGESWHHRVVLWKVALLVDGTEVTSDTMRVDSGYSKTGGAASKIIVLTANIPENATVSIKIYVVTDRPTSDNNGGYSARFVLLSSTGTTSGDNTVSEGDAMFICLGNNASYSLT